MFSMPLMDSSSGIATVSAITFGLAPGYCARTITAGGTTSGYSATGSTRSAMRPAISISSESTPAKMGLSMKNLEMFMSSLLAVGLRGRRVLRRDQGAGADALQAAHHDT